MTVLKTYTVRLLGGLAVLTFLALVLDVLWGVVTRYGLGGQAPWTEELARLLLIWLSMLGTALAYASHSHLGVDVLVRPLAHPARRVAAITIHVVVLFFVGAVMTVGGTSLLIDRWQAGQVMSTLPLAQAWMYLAVPVSGLLMAVFALDAVVQHARGHAGTAPTGKTG